MEIETIYQNCLINYGQDYLINAQGLLVVKMFHLPPFHKRQNISRSNFFCNVCQKSMPREEKFSHHIISDSGNGNSDKSDTGNRSSDTGNGHSCNICSKKFGKLDDCQDHLSVAHYNLTGIGKMDSFHCKTCGKMVRESER